VGDNLASAAASPDGKWVAGLRSEGPEKWSVTVWETATGRVQLQPQNLPHPPATTNGLAWNPNSRQLAVGTSSEVSLFTIHGQARQRLKAEWLIRDLRFSGDWVMARCDKALFVWRADSGKLLLRLPQDHLLAAALHQPRGVLAAASFQDSIRLYSLPQGRLMGTLPAGPATVNMEFVAEGRSLAAAFRYQSQRQRDGAILYDWANGKAQTPLLPQPDLMGFSVSHNGRRLVTRSEPLCRVWDGTTGQLVLERALPCPLMDSVSADGRWVASLGYDSQDLQLWDADSGREVARLPHPGRPYSFRFFQAGLLQAVDGACSVWSVESDP
jgi:WD40 repeat protein